MLLTKQNAHRLFTTKAVQTTNLYRSYPAALADPLVGTVAFSESLANLRTGLSSAGAVFALFVGDISVASVKIGMLAKSDKNPRECYTTDQTLFQRKTLQNEDLTYKRSPFGGLFPALECRQTCPSHKTCYVMTEKQRTLLNA